jgi:hypothetical protein
LGPPNTFVCSSRPPRPRAAAATARAARTRADRPRSRSDKFTRARSNDAPSSLALRIADLCHVIHARAPPAGDAATAWAYAAEAPLSPRAFLRLAPLVRPACNTEDCCVLSSNR